MKNTRYVHCTHYRLGGGDYSVLQKKLRWRPRSLRSRQAPMGCRKTSLRCYWASDVRRGLLYLVNTSEAQQKRGDVSAKLLEVRQERMDRCRCRRMLSKSGWLVPLPTTCYVLLRTRFCGHAVRMISLWSAIYSTL